MLDNVQPAPTEAAAPERPLSPSEAHEASKQGSFFPDNADVTGDELPTQSDAQSQTSENSGEMAEWFFADGVAGEGARPVWLKDKYKSVADQASAYSELEKKLGEFKGAPKDGYKFEEADGLNPEDPMLQKFLPKFKEMNMSQDAVKTLINEWADYQKSAVHVDVKEEIKKLGVEGEDMIAKTNQWMSNNLQPEVAETIKSWIHTAEDMRALNALRAFQPLSRSPGVSDMQAAVSYESLKEVKNEKLKNWDKYKEDVNYRNTINGRMERAIHREEALKKR